MITPNFSENAERDGVTLSAVTHEPPTASAAKKGDAQWVLGLGEDIGTQDFFGVKSSRL